MVNPTPESSATGSSQSTRVDAERYFALVRDGVLAEDEPVELLEGVIVAVPPMDPPHAWAIARLDSLLRRIAPAASQVRVQCPLRAGAHSVPEPDVAIVPGPSDAWQHEHPDRALLVVEVSGRSRAQDRITKAAIYASAAIPEYWIVDLVDDRLEILRDPDPAAGRYRSVRVACAGEHVAPLCAPDASIPVGDLLPAPPPGP